LTRLPPLPEEEWDDRVRESLSVLLPAKRLTPEGAGSALSTLARHPDLTEAFLPYSGYLLLRSTLPVRLRELAILRVAQRTGCAYEWVHHVRIAAKAGLSEAEIKAAGDGIAGDPLEQAVLDAVDELATDSNLSDHTWAVLAEHLDEHRRMDLVFTIGTYSLMAAAFNTFGVTPELER
jgi:4-carboxymuconolactone decarboxylase